MDIGTLISKFDTVATFDELKLNFNTLAHGIEAAGDFKVCYVQMSLRSLDAPLTFVHNRFPIAWQHVYNTKRYHKVDPSWSHARKSLLPFFWTDLGALSDVQNNMVEDAKSHGLCSGVLMPFYGRTGYSLLWLMSSTAHSEVAQAYEIFKQQLYPVLPHMFEATSKIVFNTFGILTKREAEALYWAAEGKNTEAIAKTLFIAYATVEKHISNAIKKLDALNRSHAIRMARDMGLLVAREELLNYGIRKIQHGKR